MRERRFRRRARRAQLIPLKVLVGLIVGLLLLVSSCSIIKTFTSKDKLSYERSFKEFAESFRQVANDANGASAQEHLLVDDQSVVVGFAPRWDEEYFTVLGLRPYLNYSDVEVHDAYDAQIAVVSAKRKVVVDRAFQHLETAPLRLDYRRQAFSRFFRNGRLGDGDVHVIDLHNNNAFNALHFRRPVSCPFDQGCLCLCKDPSLTDKGVLAYEQQLVSSYHDYLATPYGLPSLSSFASAVDLHKVLGGSFVSCQQWSCLELGAHPFMVPLRSSLFQDGAVDEYVVENGFVFDYSQSLLPSQKLISGTPLSVVKLPNGLLVVASRYRSVVQLEKDVSSDKLPDDLLKLLGDPGLLWLSDEGVFFLDDTVAVQPQRLAGLDAFCQSYSCKVDSSVNNHLLLKLR